MGLKTSFVAKHVLVIKICSLIDISMESQRLLTIVLKQTVKQCQTQFENMITYFARSSQQDKLLEGTAKILKDNDDKKDLINELDCLCDSLKTTPMNENDVISTMTLCKDDLQRSHDVVNQNLPSMNNKVKGTIYAFKRIISQSKDETNDKIVTNLNEMCYVKVDD